MAGVPCQNLIDANGVASIRYGDELIKWRSFGRCIRLVGKTAALVKDMMSREDAKSSSAGVKSSSR